MKVTPSFLYFLLSLILLLSFHFDKWTNRKFPLRTEMNDRRSDPKMRIFNQEVWLETARCRYMLMHNAGDRTGPAVKHLGVISEIVSLFLVITIRLLYDSGDSHCKQSIHRSWSSNFGELIKPAIISMANGQRWLETRNVAPARLSFGIEFPTSTNIWPNSFLDTW